MGLGTDSNTTFLKLRNGRIALKTSAEDPEGQEFTNPDGSVSHYRLYGHVSGYITGINQRTQEFNNGKVKYLSIIIQDRDKLFSLSLKWYSSPASYFRNQMQNFDFTQPVRFEAAKDKDGFNSLYIKQGGVLVPSKYTKQNPGDKPAWKKIVRNGEDEWDRTDEDAFYLRIIDKLNAVTIPAAQAQLNKDKTIASLDNAGMEIKSNNDTGTPNEAYAGVSEVEAVAMASEPGDDLPF